MPEVKNKNNKQNFNQKITNENSNNNEIIEKEKNEIKIENNPKELYNKPDTEDIGEIIYNDDYHEVHDYFNSEVKKYNLFTFEEDDKACAKDSEGKEIEFIFIKEGDKAYAIDYEEKNKIFIQQDKLSLDVEEMMKKGRKRKEEAIEYTKKKYTKQEPDNMLNEPTTLCSRLSSCLGRN